MLVEEVEHIIGSLASDTRITVSCGIPKLYKGKRNPSPHRTVAEALDSPYHCIRRWIDMCLRELLDQMRSHSKNSHNMLLMLNSFNEIDENMLLIPCELHKIQD